VQGSRLYQVSITVPPIAPKDAAKLLDRIAADPILIARMLNRELDPACWHLPPSWASPSSRPAGPT